MLGLRFVVLMGSSSRSVVNHVSMRSMFSGATLYEMHYARSDQLGGTMSYLINSTVEN